MYNPESAGDRSRLARERENRIAEEWEKQNEPIDDWEKLENEYIMKIYHNTVDDGFYKGGTR